MIKLINHISKYVTLSHEECIEIAESFEYIKIEKKQSLLDYSSTLDYRYFVLEGLMIATINGAKEYQNVVNIFTQDSWINLDSFGHSNQSSLFEYIAIEDTSIAYISLSDFDKLRVKFPQLNEYILCALSAQMIRYNFRIINLNVFNAEQKYEMFVSVFPDIVNRMNLYHIASYLSIKPETLSRIRNIYKSVSRNN